MSADPHEISNLVDDPSHEQKLLEMRERLDSWMNETGDRALNPESVALYDRDMQKYLKKFRNGENPESKKRSRKILL